MNALRVAVIREEIDGSASPDAQDTVLQARSVCERLERGGWECVQIVLGRNPHVLEERLLEIRPDLVFNLVESYLGLASLACVAPALCRKVGIPFTGADEGVMALAGDKAAARRLMRSASIPVPDGTSLDELRQGKFPGAGRYIIKSRFEDASLGLDGDCVVEARSRGELLWAMEELAPRMAGDCVAERYVPGREFNLALLADRHGGVRALPLAEMVFDSRMPGPAILHYAAKWQEGSAAYAASVRSFDLDDDLELSAALVDIGLRCWEVFGLAGYARIDFRVAEDGGIFVIDVNPNPCIAPDSGFVAAAGQGGLDHVEIVRRISLAALRRAGKMEAGHA